MPIKARAEGDALAMTAQDAGIPQVAGIQKSAGLWKHLTGHSASPGRDESATDQQDIVVRFADALWNAGRAA